MIVVYITVGSLDEAKTIGRALVEERLAACTNILPQMISQYIWDGALQEDEEVVLIAKTTSEGFEALKSRVLALHSYDVPCIVALDIETGHDAYLNWLTNAVS